MLEHFLSGLAEFGKVFGLPGLIILCWYLLERDKNKRASETEKMRLEVQAKNEEERNRVEAKKAEAMTAGFTSLAGKIDAHHTADIQSHQALSNGISEIKGQLTEAISWQERSDVGEIPKPPRRSSTPASGVPAGTSYAFARGKTSGGG